MQLFQMQPILGIFIVSGVVGLLLTIFDIWMIIDCLGNSSLSGAMKLVWILVILVLPLLGPILYMLMARGGARPVV